MPLPKPKKDESHDDWLDRCMANNVMQDEWPDERARYAICQSIWEDKKSMNNKEMRVLAVEAAEVRVARNADGVPTGLEGYAAIFDSPTELMPGLIERIAKGAFTSALERPDDVRGLFNHDANYVLGRTKNETLRLAQDDKGLKFDIDLPETQIARDISTSIDRGDIDGCSFAFTVKSEQWDEQDEGDLRTILDVELFDVGPVTYPAYEDTSVALRSRDNWQAKKPTPEKNCRRQRLAEMS